MNSRIRVARTANLERTRSTTKGDLILADGQPFYDKSQNALYIGDGETTVRDLFTSVNAGIRPNNNVALGINPISCLSFSSLP